MSSLNLARIIYTENRKLVFLQANWFNIAQNIDAKYAI